MDSGNLLERRLIHDYSDKWFERMMRAIVLTHPYLSIDLPTKTVYLNRKRKRRVCLMSGGQSGHEPFGVGFIAEGMLTCWVAGTLKAAPTWRRVYTAITNMIRFNPNGVLVLAPNYYGTVLNLSLAVAEARAKGMPVCMVVVGDDVSVLKAQIAGRRATVGVIFYFKIGGCMSTRGRSVGEIAAELREVDERVATMGATFSAGSKPGCPPMFHVEPGTVQLGAGIEGEMGTAIDMLPIGQIVQTLVQRIAEWLKLEAGDRLAVIVNNLGTMSPLEINIVAHETRRILFDSGYEPVRMYSGSLMTALDTNGFQISALKVTGKDDWIAALDSGTAAFAWPGSSASRPHPDYEIIAPRRKPGALRIPMDSMIIETEDRDILYRALEDVCAALRAAAPDIDQLDINPGDGDAGRHLGQFASALIPKLSTASAVKTVGELLDMLSAIARDSMGPLCGGLYSLMLLGAARESNNWYNLVRGGITVLRNYSGAGLKERTMLDALVPASEAFCTIVEARGLSRIALKAAVQKAVEGCDATREGLTSTVGINSFHDAGAYGVTLWLTTLHRRITTSRFADQ